MDVTPSWFVKKKKKNRAKATSMACYLINRLPHAALNFKVFEVVWSG